MINTSARCGGAGSVCTRISFNTKNIGIFFHCSHFTDEATEAQKNKNNLFKVTQTIEVDFGFNSEIHFPRKTCIELLFFSVLKQALLQQI